MKLFILQLYLLLLCNIINYYQIVFFNKIYCRTHIANTISFITDILTCTILTKLLSTIKPSLRKYEKKTSQNEKEMRKQALTNQAKRNPRFQAPCLTQPSSRI
uniref:Uncharacterized protein n=1 Tax=Oryza brachyantha TaxID=4533 RepID=J3LAV8_ORYBR